MPTDVRIRWNSRWGKVSPIVKAVSIKCDVPNLVAAVGRGLTVAVLYRPCGILDTLTSSVTLVVRAML